MARIVMKFGGTSVADCQHITHVATRVKNQWEAGDEIIVVVSAMSGVTNQLVGYVDTISRLYDTREYDTILSSGEQVTAGLMALQLQHLGVPARSWLGWQIPILTDEMHGKARIREIQTAEINKRLETYREVAVVAGFQGLSPKGRIATLGRGGSDTSAVALAAALRAERCDIYTDVDGIYTADPRIVAKAQKLDRISHEEMLELASLGSKVLQTRSVELAMNHQVKLQVLSSFEDKPGTMVEREDTSVEQQIVSGIAHTLDEAKITLIQISDTPGIAATIFGILAQAAINIDMIVQSVSADGQLTDMTFTVPKSDLSQALDVLEKNAQQIGYSDLIADSRICKISVVGVGMRSHAGVALTMFQTLAEKNINIQVISTSEIKISTLVAEEYAELAIRALHTAYGLDQQ